MKTPNLFHVPKTGQTRREKIAEFKAKQEIETHNAGANFGLPDSWTACLMPAARRVGYCYGVTETSDLVDCIAHVGRLLEEADLIVFEKTEIAAIRLLCQRNKIVCPF